MRAGVCQRALAGWAAGGVAAGCLEPPAGGIPRFASAATAHGSQQGAGQQRPAGKLAVRQPPHCGPANAPPMPEGLSPALQTSPSPPGHGARGAGRLVPDGGAGQRRAHVRADARARGGVPARRGPHPGALRRHEPREAVAVGGRAQGAGGQDQEPPTRGCRWARPAARGFPHLRAAAPCCRAFAWEPVVRAGRAVGSHGAPGRRALPYLGSFPASAPQAPRAAQHPSSGARRGRATPCPWPAESTGTPSGTASTTPRAGCRWRRSSGFSGSRRRRTRPRAVGGVRRGGWVGQRGVRWRAPLGGAGRGSKPHLRRGTRRAAPTTRGGLQPQRQPPTTPGPSSPALIHSTPHRPNNRLRNRQHAHARAQH